MRRYAFTLTLCAILPIFAQPDTQAPEDDGPGKGVARLSVMNGEVSIRRGDSGDFVAAALNAPLVVTDRLVTGPQSRAELQFDWANMIRIGSNAEVRLSELENRRYQIQIAVGTTTFRVLRRSDADIEISTPSVSIRPLGISVIRIMVREDGSSEVTVRLGEAEVFSPRGSERLRTGVTMLARGSVQDPEVQEVAAIPPDDWDRFNTDRDRDLERSRSYQYVSPEISGAEDLEGHGRWVSAEGYGNVWAPTVDPGWAPYRYGRWVWEDYYGWTWVSYDPWGWAPYHYGRWFNSPIYGWCWWPGGIHERHYWRPALVAFFGWGSYGGFRSGIGFGWGNVGWVALAPHETFHPWYGRGVYAGNRATVVNNINITNVYRNARVNNGITAVNSEVFGRRGITNGDLLRLNGNQLQNAGLVRGVLPVTPGRESLHFSDRNVSSSIVSRSATNRSFFSRQPARAVDRVSFDQQRQSIEQNARRTLSNGSTGGTSSGGTFGGGQPSAGGWRRAGEPAAAGTSGGAVNQPSGGNQGYRGAPAQEQGGWHRFGDPSPHTSSAGNASNSGRAPADYSGSRVQTRSDTGNWGRGSTGMGNSYNGSPARSNGYSGSPGGGAQAVRINPPMVRERPMAAPSYGNGSAGRAYPSGGGSAPHYSAPAPSRGSSPAPRSSGGGGHSGNGGRGR